SLGKAATARRKSPIACRRGRQYQYRPSSREMKMASATLPRVNVVGLGKLGAPLAAVLASRGFQVIGLDVNKVLVEALNAGKMPIVEPQLNELIAANKERLSATMDAGEAVQRTAPSFAT